MQGTVPTQQAELRAPARVGTVARSATRLSSALAANNGMNNPTLIPLPSNVDAIELGCEFARGLAPFVAISGPSGWGKSVLLQSVHTSLAKNGANPTLLPAATWVNVQHRQDQPGPLILDDVQDALRLPRDRHQLRQLLERRMRCGKVTLLSVTTDPFFPSFFHFAVTRDWATAVISEPTPDERELLVREIARFDTVYLAPGSVRLIARHLHGNGRSISGALQRLKLLKNDWTAPEDACQVCGILMPYLIGSEGWDPRDVVGDLVSKILSTRATSPTDYADITAFILLKVIGLSEQEVSAFLHLTPTQVFQRASAISHGCRDPLLAQAVVACKSAVVQHFAGG